MTAKITTDEIEVIAALVSKSTAITTQADDEFQNLLGRVHNILYLKRAEIRMAERLAERLSGKREK